MKIVLSRKGFDSAAGGVASPILPDGKMLSLPIPDRSSPITYADISKAKTKLGWVPEITVQDMCAEMVAHDYQAATRMTLLRQHGHDMPVSLENG